MERNKHKIKRRQRVGGPMGDVHHDDEEVLPAGHGRPLFEKQRRA